MRPLPSLPRKRGREGRGHALTRPKSGLWNCQSSFSGRAYTVPALRIRYTDPNDQKPRPMARLRSPRSRVSSAERNIVGSFVNGLMPFRAFVAGFLTTTNLGKARTKKAPLFFSFLLPFFC